ncbi:MAG TPA: diguanylate cyclase [Solirubrobacterales bacterium]
MRRRFWLGIAAVTLVAVGSVLAAFLVYQDDREDFNQMQQDEAIRAAHQMEAVAGLSVDQLSSAAAFFKAEDDLSRHEFQVYGNTLLRQGALSATAYILRVPGAKRGMYEQRHGIGIIEKVFPGKFRRADPQSVYFPVTYATAEQSTERALGYDLGQDPFRGAFLDRAASSGVATSTPVGPLLIGGTGIAVFRAVYHDGAPVKTAAQRQRALVGFAAGSFRIEDLATAAAETVSPGVHLQLQAGGITVFGATEDLSGGASVPLKIADRTWALTVKDPDGPGLSLPIALAVLGISLAALLTALILTGSRKERMQELERQATQDALTGLDNRRRFERDLATAMARSWRDRSSGALLILDIDDFKRVNDSQGHPAGDRLIQEVAEVLRRRTRASDTLARLGGDEFAVILPRSSREEAQIAAEAIASEVRAYRSMEGTEPVTVSVGVAMFGDDPRTSAATVFSEADTAMYAAKDEGRDGVRVFDPVAVREDVRSQR